jgi:hypothetical protein
MIVHYRERRTPKEMAAILLSDLVALMPDDWRPEPEVTEAEAREVRRQLEAYQERVYALLGYLPRGRRRSPLEEAAKSVLALRNAAEGRPVCGWKPRTDS